MSTNIGTLISSSIRPNNSLDPIASAFANEIKGGLHGYATISERDSIIIERREWGMFVIVYNDLDINNNKTYQLTYGYANTNINDNLNWKEFSSSSNSSTEWLNSVLSVSYVQPVTPLVASRYLVGLKPGDSITGSTWGLYSSGFVAEYNLSLNSWNIISPTQGMTVRVDNEPNSKYVYNGVYPSGEWILEKFSQIFYIEPLTSNGITYSVGTTPSFTTYDKSTIFIAKFNTTNSATASLSLNVNGIGLVQIKKASPLGAVDLLVNEIGVNILYTIIYNGSYFQISSPFTENRNNYVNYYIPTNYEITVPNYEQYWVYGDLKIDGKLTNYGEVIIANGNLILGTAGTFSNHGELHLIELGSESSFVEFNTVTKSELDILISNSDLEVGSKYKVIGVNSSLYGGTDIYVDAILPNKISEYGSGIFYNPKYSSIDIWTNQMNPTFSNIFGTFSNGEYVISNNSAIGKLIGIGLIEYISGNWTSATSIIGSFSSASASIIGAVNPNYATGSKVAWGGSVWINNNGNIGNSLDYYTLNSSWTYATISNIDYNTVINDIKYDHATDLIIYRKDNNNNVIDCSIDSILLNPIKDFKWGAINISHNFIKDSYFNCLNFRGSSINNRIYNSTIGFCYSDTTGSIHGNVVDLGSVISNNILTQTGGIFNNKVNKGIINNNSLHNSRIDGCSIDSNSSFISSNTAINSFIVSNSIKNGASISNNLLVSSQFNFNNLNNGSINNNKIYTSKIESNSLLISSDTISNNYITFSTNGISQNEIRDGKITNNYILGLGIYNNKIFNGSLVNGNTFSGATPNIYGNIFLSSDILNNNAGFMLYYNELNMSKIMNNSFVSSTINTNKISGSRISLGTFSGLSMYNNTLNNSYFTFSNTSILTSKTITNLTSIGINTLDNFSTASIIFSPYTKNAFIRQDGLARISYYDNNDILIITNINN